MNYDKKYEKVCAVYNISEIREWHDRAIM